MPKSDISNNNQLALGADASWEDIAAAQGRQERAQVALPLSMAGVQATLDQMTVERQWEDDGSGRRRPTGPVVTDEQGRADVTCMVTLRQGAASVPVRLRHRWMTTTEWLALAGAAGVPGGVAIEGAAIAPYALPPRDGQRSMTYGYTMRGRVVPTPAPAGAPGKGD